MLENTDCNIFNDLLRDTHLPIGGRGFAAENSFFESVFFELFGVTGSNESFESILFYSSEYQSSHLCNNEVPTKK